MVICPVSYGLGRWRGRNGKPQFVRLAPAICRESYEAGFFAGREARQTRPIQVKGR